MLLGDLYLSICSSVFSDVLASSGVLCSVFPSLSRALIPGSAGSCDSDEDGEESLQIEEYDD